MWAADEPGHAKQRSRRGGNRQNHVDGFATNQALLTNKDNRGKFSPRCSER